MADDMLTAADGSALEEGAHCSLPSIELARRSNLYKEEVIPFVAGITREDGLLRVTMKTGPDKTQAIARKMAALEADCCSFMTIGYARNGAPTTISITAPDTFLDTITTWGFGTSPVVDIAPLPREG